MKVCKKDPVQTHIKILVVTITGKRRHKKYDELFAVNPESRGFWKDSLILNHYSGFWPSGRFKIE